MFHLSVCLSAYGLELACPSLCFGDRYNELHVDMIGWPCVPSCICICVSVCSSLCGLESARLSLRPGASRSKLHAGMIGRPENDLRHIGHVGYDGVTFGDVSFVGDDYNVLHASTAVNSSSNNTAREFIHDCD